MSSNSLSNDAGDDFFDEFLGDDEEVFEEPVGFGGGVTRADLPEASGVPDDVFENMSRVSEFRRASRRGDGVAPKVVVREKRVVNEALESSRPVEEVYVAEDRSGVNDGESGSGVVPGDVWDGGGKPRERYRWVRDNGKLNGHELEFFENLEVSRSKVLRGESGVDYLRAPVGVDETDVERKERSRKVTRAVFGRDAFKRGSKLSFGVKDKDMVDFLAQFRYANARQLSQLFSESPATSYSRLKKLRTAGLVIDKKLIGTEPVWFLTDAGMLLSGYDLPRITEARLTYSMFPHQFTVNHVAANLWGANVNVLNLPGYPAKNRVDLTGKEVYGESLVSELLVQSSFGKLKLFDRADVYLPTIKSNIEKAFKKWENAGGVEFGPSPEQVFGNEYMWILFPPMAVKLSYHVPDLVINRPRNADGSPNSIAVEIEIANKSEETYRKTLTAYRHDKSIYRGVVWVCKSVGAARKLKRIADDIGLSSEGRISIVPIMTSDGVFKGKDLWTL